MPKASDGLFELFQHVSIIDSEAVDNKHLDSWVRSAHCRTKWTLRENDETSDGWVCEALTENGGAN